MTHAKEHLPEADTWIAEITSARDRLQALNEQVRRSQVDKKDMSPEVAAAREAWIKVYGAAKLQVETVLRLAGRTDLMPLIFDDLAETQRTASDAEPQPEDPSNTSWK